MVKKIAGHNRDRSKERERKELHPKRLRLKHLHKDVAADRRELQDISPESLPPASSSNAARQARSRLNITFPVNWQDLHTRKSPADGGDDRSDDESSPEK